jgi:hypothetical protein
MYQFISNSSVKQAEKRAAEKMQAKPGMFLQHGGGRKC